MNCTITLLEKNDLGKYEKEGSLSTLTIGYTEPNTGADIHFLWMVSLCMHPTVGITVARHRLRNKLNLERDDNLVTFLSKY